VEFIGCLCGILWVMVPDTFSSLTPLVPLLFATDELPNLIALDAAGFKIADSQIVIVHRKLPSVGSNGRTVILFTPNIRYLEAMLFPSAKAIRTCARSKVLSLFMEHIVRPRSGRVKNNSA
jgi:hypothetical protein